MKKTSTRLLSLISIVLCISFVNNSLANQNPITPPDGFVPGGMSQGQSLKCRAYLYIPEDQPFNPQNNYPLYFIQMGTGLNTMGAPDEKSGFDQQVLKSDGHEYLLVMDKPGISYDPSSNKAKIERDSPGYYDYYTTNNLINCANNALIWANNYLNNFKRPIIIWGHSEGSIVMTNLAYNILSAPQNTDLYNVQNQLKGLFLSGVLIDSIPDITKYQFNYPSDTYNTYMGYFTGGYTQTNNDYFYNNFGVGYYWISYGLTKPIPNSISTLLSKISGTDKGNSVPIEIFQGLNDKNTNPQSVLAYETQNNAKPVGQQLNIRARYYNAAHMLDTNAFSDIGLSLKSDIK